MHQHEQSETHRQNAKKQITFVDCSVCSSVHVAGSCSITASMNSVDSVAPAQAVGGDPVPLSADGGQTAVSKKRPSAKGAAAS